MDILQGLNGKQLEAVTTTEGPVLVIAGAGSGKTRVLTHRVAYLISEKNVLPWNILTITFTNKAANEMKERIERVVGESAKDVWSGTFHSICVRILRKHIEKIGFTSNFNIYDKTDTKSIVKECIKELNLDDKMFNDKMVLSRISKLKNDMISVAESKIKAGSNFLDSKVAEIYGAYQNKLKINNGLDFDDIIWDTIKIFLENPEVLAYYQEKFKYILVDEYQDTNKSQFMLINLLGAMYGNIFVVGDNDQSIYAFRGADITNILNFEHDYPGAKTIKLEQNYRSTKQILDVANCIIKNNESKIQKELWTENTNGVKPIYINVHDQYDEASYIGKVIHDGVKAGKKYSDYAILYRTNVQSRVIEDEFLKDGIPYKVIGGMKFYDRKEVKDIIAYLKVIVNPSDSISLKRIINEPKRGLGDTTINKVEAIASENKISMFDVIREADKYELKASAVLKDFAQMILDFNEIVNNIEIEELVNRVLDVTGYMRMLVAEDSIESRSRIENIQELVSIIDEFSKESADNSLTQFLENIALVADIDALEENPEFVVMMTMHNAKGLEFPIVFVVGMEEGLFPSSQSFNEDNGIEEERRLCYVAVTRAKECLHFSSANLRTIYGSTTATMPSRFIKEIDEQYIEQIDKDKEDKYDESKIENIAKSEKSNIFKSAEMFLNSLNSVNKPKNDLSAYKVGQTVSHRKFGIGKIIKIEPEDDDLKIEIEFERFGVKRLMANFAGLEIME